MPVSDAALPHQTDSCNDWTRYNAQWAMILSGAQARTPAVPTSATVAGCAGFGAFYYFLLSALPLTIKVRRRAQG